VHYCLPRYENEGGVQLAGGLEPKVVTGIDAHSRFIVFAKVVVPATAQPECLAMTGALRHHRCARGFLTGIQVVHRAAHPSAVGGGAVGAGLPLERNQPVADQDRVADDEKIERLHKPLRAELLLHVLLQAATSVPGPRSQPLITVQSWRRPNMCPGCCLLPQVGSPNGARISL
jgi:hypothetical protein